MANVAPNATGRMAGSVHDSWRLIRAETNNTTGYTFFSVDVTDADAPFDDIATDSSTGIIRMSGFDALALIFFGTDAANEDAQIIVEAIDPVVDTDGETITGFLGVPVAEIEPVLGAKQVASGDALVGITGVDAGDYIADIVQIQTSTSLTLSSGSTPATIKSSTTALGDNPDEIGVAIVPTLGSYAARVYVICNGGSSASATFGVIGKRVASDRVSR